MKYNENLIYLQIILYTKEKKQKVYNACRYTVDIVHLNSSLGDGIYKLPPSVKKSSDNDKHIRKPL